VELDGEGLNADPAVSMTSLWLKEPHDGLPRSCSEGRAEVVVIGRGVTGCSCALTLAEHGVRVRLYDAREIAGGASGRNGGFAPRGAAVPYDGARRDLGDERARQLMELTERSLDCMVGTGRRRVPAPRKPAARLRS
jgi:folate-dependent tRNA-U54 methylase TrmFO/GidA